MRERKIVKFRVDMYDDTKSKIIDMKPERDLIHYVWTRFVVLAGKVNLEGDLYLSKNIPYTIETLAIEFNRGTYQVKLALDVLMELEMIELTNNNVYRVKNFAKHQNIKVKEKIKSNDNEEDIKNEEVPIKENFENEIYDDKDDESKNKTNQNEVENVGGNNGSNLESNPIEIKKVDNSMSTDKINHNSQDNIPIFLEGKRKKNTNKNKKKDLHLDDSIDLSIDSINEEMEDNPMVWFSDGEKPLGEGENVIGYWSF
ncbi:phage replisome organizer [Clostridium chromiireducens]|uniref:Phage replisome organizer n=1 Tax=Clostridium chromiireducens TaxID=225345 RepID=A0A964RJA9_9CLOT|nr:phage replisome organizer N-terminal domain-containing protein [Clostridium chromiireducens]MVX62581.1 phage replisome organizer [Clostridium chromiireducens]